MRKQNGDLEQLVKGVVIVVPGTDERQTREGWVMLGVQTLAKCTGWDREPAGRHA